jgi:hypothetical protein
MTKRKAPPYVSVDVRIIATTWKPVSGPEEALKEANANRLARAKFDQAMTTDDAVIRHAMLARIEDDGTAGAALLRYAREILVAEKRKKKIGDSNKSKKHKRDMNGKRYCVMADAICSKKKSLAGNYEGLARATRENCESKAKKSRPKLS